MKANFELRSPALNPEVQQSVTSHIFSSYRNLITYCSKSGKLAGQVGLRSIKISVRGKAAAREKGKNS